MACKNNTKNMLELELKQARTIGQNTKYARRVNHELHYNYMEHMKAHQTSQKQKYVMPKYTQINTETQSMHARMMGSFGKPIRGLFYTCMMDTHNGKTNS